MKVEYNITQNKFNASLNQEVTEIKLQFQTGYYPIPVGLENYYTKNETDLLLENYYLKTETYSQDEVDSLFSNETLDAITDRGNTTENDITVGGVTTNYVQLDTTSSNTYNIGKVYWNETKGTYDFGLKNNVTLQLGQEQYVYGKAYSAISNGQLVMYRTSQGGHILFEPANFTQLSTNPDLIIGVATQDIALNEFGYITTFGEVNTLNTSSFADGGTLYFGSGNVLQNTAPTGSYFIVGRVNRSHATQGSIFVKPYFVDGNLESKSNKSDSYTASSSTTYASTKALVDGLATKLSKGTYTGTASDLVPYNGATQNVNIGAYYFESSQGFKKTSGTSNQALTADGNVFDLTTKADLVDGKVPSSQLPSYVDDVLEFANLASFPATGESGKIYIAIDTNITYRWTGTGYAEISASLALGETSSTAYRGDRGKIAFDHSQTIGNPHGTTKGDIGLGNVPNADATNPANITQSASYRFVTDTEKATWNAKQNALTNPITGTGTSGFHAKFNDTSTLTNSIIYDNGTNLGVSNTDPRAKLSVGSNNGGSKIMPTNTKVWIQGSGGASSTDLQSRISIGFNENPDYGFYFGTINVDYGSTPMIGVLGTRDASSDKPVLYVKDSKIGVATMNPSEKLDVNGYVKATGFKKEGGTSTQFLKADGSLDGNTYLTSYTETDTLASVTARGASTSTAVTFNGGITVSGGNIELYSTQIVDMSNTSVFSTSNYYPVVIPVGTYGMTIQIQNNLDTNVPSWATHGAGFTLNLTWRANGAGWGTTEIKRRVLQYHERFANVRICGGITQMANSSQEVVWLRGGGQYRIIVSRPATISAKSSSYTHSSETVSPTSTELNNIWDATTGVEKFYATNIYSSGNVGIGTTSPSEKLEVNGNVKATSFIKSGGTSSQYLMADGSVSTLTNPVTGTGTTNFIPKFLSTGTVGNSLIYDNGTDVGIGTSTPFAKLTVKQGNSIGLEETPTSNPNTRRWWIINDFNEYGDFGISTASTKGANTPDINRFYISFQGNVGIGTTSPNEKLTVSGKIYAYPRQPVVLSGQGSPYYGTNITLASDIGSTQGANRIWSRYDGTGSGATTFERSTNSQAYNSDPQLLTYTESMRIAGNGNVGIGTTSPSEALHVNGNLLVQLSNSMTTRNVAQIKQLGDSGVTGARNWALRGVYQYDSGVFGNAEGGDLDLIKSWNGNTILATKTDGSPLGNVGIGTTSPSAKLTINSIANSNDNAILLYSNNTTANSYVSIGSYYANGNTNVNSQIRFGNESDYGAGSFLAFATGTSTSLEKVRITSSGKVGIGTTSPSTLLDVNSWATFLNNAGNRLKIWDGTDNIPTISADNLLALQSPTIQFYATDVTDSNNNSIYLKLKTVNGNVAIDNSYHNKIVRITASCTITIPAGLRTDFNCTFEVIGAYTAQFVDGSGATTSAPFGRYLKTDLTAMFYCTGTASNYRLNGSLATS